MLLLALRVTKDASVWNMIRGKPLSPGPMAMGQMATGYPKRFGKKKNRPIHLSSLRVSFLTHRPILSLNKANDVSFSFSATADWAQNIFEGSVSPQVINP